MIPRPARELGCLLHCCWTCIESWIDVVDLMLSLKATEVGVEKIVQQTCRVMGLLLLSNPPPPNYSSSNSNNNGLVDTKKGGYKRDVSSSTSILTGMMDGI